MPGYPDDFSGVNVDNFNIFYGDLMNSIQDYHFMIYMASLTPLQQFALKCDGVSPNCTVPECHPYQAHLSKGKCQDICIKIDLPRITLTLGTCNSNPPVCCSYNTKYCPCYNSMGLFSGFIKSVSVTTDPGACAGVGPQVSTCNHTTHWTHYIPCQALCPTQ
ncbi:MAG: hypothetical protein RBT61_10455 [Candidatus Kapabacteria bacterium]|jgi:hypothetical protein|nr:hypothetical protein [Candidatus Kapabacteria bacterium]